MVAGAGMFATGHPVQRGIPPLRANVLPWGMDLMEILGNEIIGWIVAATMGSVATWIGRSLFLRGAMKALKAENAELLKRDASLDRKNAKLEQRLDMVQNQIARMAVPSPRRALPALVEYHPDDSPDWLPPKGWIRKSEAVRLARDYVFAVPDKSRADVAALVVEEFSEEHPKHYDKGRRYIERIPFEAWLLTHRLPLPQRWQWRGRATGIGANEHGEIMVYDPTDTTTPIVYD